MQNADMFEGREVEIFFVVQISLSLLKQSLHTTIQLSRSPSTAIVNPSPKKGGHAKSIVRKNNICDFMTEKGIILH